MQASLIGLLAAVLTMLLLRAILVPADITTFTRVDYILTGEILILVAIGIVAYISSTYAATSDGRPTDA